MTVALVTKGNIVSTILAKTTPSVYQTLATMAESVSLQTLPTSVFVQKSTEGQTVNTLTFVSVTPPVGKILKGVKIYPRGPSASAMLAGGAALVRRTSMSVKLSPILAKMMEPAEIPPGDLFVSVPWSTLGIGAPSTSPNQSTAAPASSVSMEGSVWSRTEVRWCATAPKASLGICVRDLVSLPEALVRVCLKGSMGVLPKGWEKFQGGQWVGVK